MKFQCPKENGEVMFMHDLIKNGKEKFLEIFQENGFVRMQTPEQIDPKNMNPSIRPTKSISGSYGASNIILARIYIQSVEFLKMINHERHEDKKSKIVCDLREASESLIKCQSIVKNLESQSGNEIFRCQNQIIKDSSVQIPHIQNLETETKEFFVNLKDFMRSLVKIFKDFFDDQDSRITDAYFHKIVEIYKEKLCEDHVLIKLLMSNKKFLWSLIEIRNAFEHSANNPLILKTENFLLNSKNEVEYPYISLKGERMHEKFDEFFYIPVDISSILNEMLIFGESFILICIKEFLPDFIFFYEIEESSRDKKMPIRFKPNLAPEIISKLQ